ncbi:CbtA family protein [Rhodococcus opacus]|nr:CbtA family protein [Rhodococcus opacus]
MGARRQASPRLSLPLSRAAQMNSSTVRFLLVRGMLAGVLSGVLAFGLGYLVGEKPLRAALDFEATHSAEPATEVVSRSMQETAGLATGVLVFGAALGGIAALAFCFALGRIGRFGPRATAALIALGGFVTVFLVPFLKYPANPPAVSDPDTLDQRTILYVLMVVLSVLLGIAAVLIGRYLGPRLGNWNATVLASIAFVAAAALALAFGPAVNEMPEAFPAGVVWQFRLSAAGMQTVLWAAFAVIFGYLAESVLQAQTLVPHRSPKPAPGI